MPPKNNKEKTTLPSYATAASRYNKSVESARPPGAPLLASAPAQTRPDSLTRRSTTHDSSNPPLLETPRPPCNLEDMDITEEDECLLQEQPTITPHPPTPQPLAPITPIHRPPSPPSAPSTSGTSSSSSSSLAPPGELPLLSEAGKILLEGRRKLRKLKSQLERVSSHLDFTKECQDHHATPKGLRVGVKCHAMLADYSNVRQRFSETRCQAEGSFVSHLSDHYRVTRDRLLRDLLGVEETVRRALPCLTPQKRSTSPIYVGVGSDNFHNTGNASPKKCI